ncbi:MAG: glycosyltransferase family 4 protein [Thermoleophilia bacterium]
MIDWPGLGTYSRSLLKNYASVPDVEIVCFYNNSTRGLIPRSDNIECVPLNQDPSSPRHLHDIGRIINKSGCDLFHTPHVVAPAGLDCILLVTAHDLIPLQFPKTIAMRQRRNSRALLKNAILKADHIITASRASMSYLKQYFDLPSGRITLVLDGVDRTFFYRRSDAEITTVLDKYGIRPPHLLWLGSFMPHKNIIALIEAFEMLPDDLISQYQLTLAGKQIGHHWKKISKRIGDANLSDRITCPGFIDDADLPALFSSSSLFCFPSLYEGFGLPPLEAMACGTPVLCSNLTSLPEVVGGAGYLADPDASSIRDGIIRILNDPVLKKQLRQLGLERAALFTWEKTAAETLAVYHDLV